MCKKRAAALTLRLAEDEMVLGCLLLGSPLTSELMENAGYNEALVDLERGASGAAEALIQIQALTATPAAGGAAMRGKR